VSIRIKTAAIYCRASNGDQEGGDKGGKEYRSENNLRPGEAYSPGFFLVVVDTYNPSLLMFWFGTAALINGILTIKTMYDKNKLEEMSYAHVVVAKIPKMWRELKWH